VERSYEDNLSELAAPDAQQAWFFVTTVPLSRH
jgi:hypothetical protein